MIFQRRRLNLVQIFTLLSFLCISAGAVVLGLVMSESCRAGFERLERNMTGDYIQQQFREHFGDDLFEDPAVLKNPETIEVLSQAMSFADVFRIKVYSVSGRILWSNEQHLIGRVFENELLHSALQGEIVSEIEESERDEHVYEREHAVVQEVYVPIHSTASGKLLGVIEVYREPKVYLQAVKKAVLSSWTVAVGGGVCLYLVLLVVVTRAYRKEKRLEADVQAHSEEILRETEKLHSIVGAIGAGLCVVDAEDRIRWVNSVLERWFGPENEILGRSYFDVVWGCSEPCEPVTRAAGEAAHEAVPCQRQGVLQSGEPRWFEVTATPIREAEGSVGQALVLVVDITERKAIQMRLIQAGKMAALGELAGSVVHEINNPIGVISLRVTHLLSRLGPDLQESQIRVALEEIRRHSERVGNTASELLSFSRQSIGERRDVDLRRVAREAVHLVEHRLRDLSILLHTEMDEEPCIVAGDANALQQVVVNILNNAVDAMPSGGRISIRVRTTRPTGRTKRVAVLAVEDTGVGMPPHVRDRMFDFFFTTKEKAQGTGLGLPISRRIVTDHEGEIRVESEEGKGTRFEILLPLAGRSEPAEQLQAT